MDGRAWPTGRKAIGPAQDVGVADCRAVRTDSVSATRCRSQSAVVMQHSTSPPAPCPASSQPGRLDRPRGHMTLICSGWPTKDSSLSLLSVAQVRFLSRHSRHICRCAEPPVTPPLKAGLQGDTCWCTGVILFLCTGWA